MKNFRQTIFLACGLLLTLAAFPVFAQQEEKTEINKMPFEDFARRIEQQIKAGKIDLAKSFSVEIEGVLTKVGRLDPKQSKFTKSAGDATMVEVGKSFIEAVGDSGVFQYLQNLGVEKITFAVSQDEKQVTAIIKSETETVNRAKTMASGLNMMLKMAAMQNKNEDNKVMLKYLNVAADDKTFIINFAAPREAIHGLVKKHLAKMTTKESGE